MSTQIPRTVKDIRKTATMNLNEAQKRLAEYDTKLEYLIGKPWGKAYGFLWRKRHVFRTTEEIKIAIDREYGTWFMAPEAREFLGRDYEWNRWKANRQTRIMKNWIENMLGLTDNTEILLSLSDHTEIFRFSLDKTI